MELKSSSLFAEDLRSSPASNQESMSVHSTSEQPLTKPATTTTIAEEMLEPPAPGYYDTSIQSDDELDVDTPTISHTADCTPDGPTEPATPLVEHDFFDQAHVQDENNEISVCDLREHEIRESELRQIEISEQERLAREIKEREWQRMRDRELDRERVRERMELEREEIEREDRLEYEHKERKRLERMREQDECKDKLGQMIAAASSQQQKRINRLSTISVVSSIAAIMPYITINSKDESDGMTPPFPKDFYSTPEFNEDSFSRSCFAPNQRKGPCTTPSSAKTAPPSRVRLHRTPTDMRKSQHQDRFSMLMQQAVINSRRYNSPGLAQQTVAELSNTLDSSFDFPTATASDLWTTPLSANAETPPGTHKSSKVFRKSVRQLRHKSRMFFPNPMKLWASSSNVFKSSAESNTTLDAANVEHSDIGTIDFDIINYPDTNFCSGNFGSTNVGTANFELPNDNCDAESFALTYGTSRSMFHNVNEIPSLTEVPSLDHPSSDGPSLEPSVKTVNTETTVPSINKSKKNRLQVFLRSMLRV